MVDAAARTAIAELLVRYVRAIDNDELEAWPGFFDEDGQYLITTRANYAKRWPIGLIYCDGRGMMQDRVTAVRQAIVFPPHVYCHIVGMPLIAASAGQVYQVESNFHILRTGMDGAIVTYACGRYLDEISLRQERAFFRKRTVVLASSRIDTLLVIPL